MELFKMIHGIWSGLMLISLGYSLFSGNLDVMTAAVMDGAKDALNLCIVMAAVVGLWSGLMEIGVHSGVMEGLSRVMGPFLKWMFPGIKKNKKVMKYIAFNFAANVLGLGWAATPSGLGAMEELKGETEDDEATDEMCTFVLLNVSSLQLIPLTTIVYRSQYGSSVPTAIVIPGLFATAVSTLTAILFSKMMCKKSGKKKVR